VYKTKVRFTPRMTEEGCHTEHWSRTFSKLTRKVLCPSWKTKQKIVDKSEGFGGSLCVGTGRLWPQHRKETGRERPCPSCADRIEHPGRQRAHVGEEVWPAAIFLQREKEENSLCCMAAKKYTQGGNGRVCADNGAGQLGFGGIAGGSGGMG